jgi:uncharacterized membrane protein HdeD (DUF308 family)
VIALRNAIGRASEPRWVWVLVVLLLAVLLVLVGLHDLEHAAETGDLLLCIAIASLIAVFFIRHGTTRAVLLVPTGRDPPQRSRVIASTFQLAAHSQPLRQ